MWKVMRQGEYILYTVFNAKSQEKQKTDCHKYKLFIEDTEWKKEGFRVIVSSPPSVEER